MPPSGNAGTGCGRRRCRQKAVSKSLDWVDDDARTLMGTHDA
jgi:hypothetical protein